MSVAISHTEEIAVTGSSDGSIAIWDISKMPRLVNTISGPGMSTYSLILFLFLFSLSLSFLFLLFITLFSFSFFFSFNSSDSFLICLCRGSC